MQTPRAALLLLPGLLAALALPAVAGEGDRKGPPKEGKAAPSGDESAKGGEGYGGEDRVVLAMRKVLGEGLTLDTDKDGRLSAKELPEAEACLALFDADQDGFVTKEEIKKFASEVGTKGEVPAPKKDEPRRKGPVRKAPVEPAGPHMPDEPFADWAKRVVASDPRFQAEPRAQQILESFDQNPKDGKVLRAEGATSLERNPECAEVVVGHRRVERHRHCIRRRR